MKSKLAIITTHPIQYFAPMFALLSKSCNLKVFYTWGLAGVGEKIDTDFGKKIEWDIPLLNGYNYELLENTAKNPGSHRFMGIQNPKIIHKIKDFNPSAILIYGWAYRSHLQVIRHFSGRVPIWFRGDSTLLNEGARWKSWARKLALFYIYKHVDKAFYVGTQNKKYFKEFGLKEVQLIFAPHSVDNERFAEDRSIEADAIRANLGIPQNDILVLFAGKLEWKKNPALLLEEFMKLDKPNVHLLFVGNGALEKELKSRSNNFLSQNIHFLDFQNQYRMPIVYQSCDLFCLPSKSETWGLVVNEAMACGKAILVSDMVGCAKDLVSPSLNGNIFKSENSIDLTKHLKLLLSNKPKLAAMGAASKIIIKKWSFEKQVAQILSAFNESY